MGKQRREYGAGSLRRHRGSRIWYLRYYLPDGRRIEESSGTHVKQKALSLLQKRLGEREQGIAPAQDAKRLRYENIRQSLLDDYAIRGRRSLRSNGHLSFGGLTHLDKFFVGKSVAAITTDVIRKFIAEKQAAGAQPSTINRSLALLRRMMNIAKTENKIQVLPYFPTLKENPPRKGFIGHEQFGRLLSVLPEKLRPLIMLLYWCGCRIGEARKITWEQIDLDKRQIVMYGEQTKSGQTRILPLPDQLVDILQSVPESNRRGRVFYLGSFRRSWARACEQAGLGRRIKTANGFPKYEGLLVHDLRRSAIRNLRESGVSETVIMVISGHKTQSVFRRYSIVSVEDLHKAMRQVQASLRVIDVQSVPADAPSGNGGNGQEEVGRTTIELPKNGGNLG
jgi:integrase